MEMTNLSLPCQGSKGWLDQDRNRLFIPQRMLGFTSLRPCSSSNVMAASFIRSSGIVAQGFKELLDGEGRRLKSEIFEGYSSGFYFCTPLLRPILFHRGAGLGQWCPGIITIVATGDGQDLDLFSCQIGLKVLIECLEARNVMPAHEGKRSI